MEIDFPTLKGRFDLRLYKDEINKNHLALVKGEVEDEKNILVRLHSKCLTGDVFGSMRCDCNSQLNQAMDIIEENENGVLLYLNQEGRGIGLESKLESYKLQDQGLDTVEANEELGYEADTREYDVAAEILKDLGIKSLRLLSNNPEKVEALRENGLIVAERIPLNPRVTSENIDYLKTKSSRLNHKINLEKSSQLTPEREKILRFFSRKNQENEKNITLFFKQNLNGEIIDPNQEIDYKEDKELIFLEKNLERGNEKVINSIKELENPNNLLESEKKNIFIKPNPPLLRELISNNLYTNFISIIFPNKKGEHIDNLNKLFKEAKELSYSDLGKLVVAYGSN